MAAAPGPRTLAQRLDGWVGRKSSTCGVVATRAYGAAVMPDAMLQLVSHAIDGRLVPASRDGGLPAHVAGPDDSDAVDGVPLCRLPLGFENVASRTLDDIAPGGIWLRDPLNMAICPVVFTHKALVLVCVGPGAQYSGLRLVCSSDAVVPLFGVGPSLVPVRGQRTLRDALSGTKRADGAADLFVTTSAPRDAPEEFYVSVDVPQRARDGTTLTVSTYVVDFAQLDDAELAPAAAAGSKDDTDMVHRTLLARYGGARPIRTDGSDPALVAIITRIGDGARKGGKAAAAAGVTSGTGKQQQE